ncbi:MAG: hypothetical protein ACI8Q1_001845 [Parvicella sp.]|jgi:hypothetical protein
MKLNYRLLIVTSFIFFLCFGNIFKLVLINILHLPNFISPVRDLIFIAFFIQSISMLQSRRDLNVVLTLSFILVIFSGIYISTGFEENVYRESIYYLRSYIYPLLFFTGVYLHRFWIAKNHSKVLTFCLVVNVAVIMLGIILYLYFWSDRSIFHSLLGNEASYVWYIDKAFILRMGIPFAGPNTFGIYLASQVFLIFYLRSQFVLERGVSRFLITMNLVALFLTFSRSSILFVLVAFVLQYLINFKVKNLLILLKQILLLSILVFLFGLVLNIISDQALIKWVQGTLTGNDSSIGGHLNIFSQFLERFDDFYLFGYENGLVGPRAYLFHDSYFEVKNSENSFLVVLYDMGMIVGVCYLLLFISTAALTITNKFAVALYVGIMVNFQFLPNIYELDALMMIFFNIGLISFLYYGNSKLSRATVNNT